VLENKSQLSPQINPRVLLKGGGDLASGVAYRLHKTGFKVLILEKDSPLAVRRTVAYASALYEEEVEVERVKAVKVTDMTSCEKAQQQGKIAVTSLSRQEEILPYYDNQIVIDGRMLKDSVDTDCKEASLVIGLGPGFIAGENCHAVIETCRGHFLGRAIYKGAAEPDTGEPGSILGYSRERVLHAPIEGEFKTNKSIGDEIDKGDTIGYIKEKVITAEISGVIRGLLPSGIYVSRETKLGDIDPRNNPDYCYYISDKALAVAGGVLEAIFNWTFSS